MSTDGLHVPVASPVHRLPPEVKVVAALVLVLAVVATPRGAVWALGTHLGVLLAVVAAARLRPLLVLRRLRIELPFLAFAALLPVVGADPRVDVLGLPLSEPGLAAAGALAAKGTLGALAAIVLSATTPVPELLRGLARLRVPRLLVAIAGSMVRYLDVVAAEAGRMRVARISRGDDPRWLGQARATAATAGTLFVRAYERGERVHLAMAARGHDGTLPPAARSGPPGAGDVARAALAPLACVAVTAVALAGR